ncbi:hypothetical protein [Winogradskya humida]|uniref:Uncharacterized protein n=1 Tax=Winogradskya humida TaxID=113566 RepID=A0ABQ3ZFP9_9ACTN|nr:hypothetical protein [Actinoplanes humidus]GIE17354.1 hypothetical protein Ahu01nite_004560 [Actinoplanes humidus]
MTRGRLIGIGAALGVLIMLVGLVVWVLSRTGDQSLCPSVVVSHSELPTSPVVPALVMQALAETTLMKPEACPA